MDFEKGGISHLFVIKSFYWTFLNKEARWQFASSRNMLPIQNFKIYTGCVRLLGKPEGKWPLGRPRRRWEENIKMDLQEVECDGMDWIDLAQDRDSWRAFVNAVMNLRVPQNARNFLTRWELISSSRRTLLHGVLSTRTDYSVKCIHDSM